MKFSQFRGGECCVVKILVFWYNARGTMTHKFVELKKFNAEAIHYLNDDTMHVALDCQESVMKYSYLKKMFVLKFTPIDDMKSCLK